MNVVSSPLMLEESFRITRIYKLSSKLVVLSGVPLKKDSYKINSGKYIVSVRVNLRDLPVSPSIGQHWNVKGIKTIKHIENEDSDYVLEDHSFTQAQLQCTLPETGEAFVRFIASQRDFKGIGEQKARQIWKYYQSRLYELLDCDSEANRAELSSVLSSQSIDALYAGYGKYTNLKEANWLTKHNIPIEIQQRLFKYHEKKSVDAIKADPYRLMTFGLSFSEVDELAKKHFHVKSDDERRLISAVEATLQKEISKGNTYADKASVRQGVSKILRDTALVELALGLPVEKTRFIVNADMGIYHPTGQLLLEAVVAKRLVALSLSNEIKQQSVSFAVQQAKQDLLYDLNPKQNEAVDTALQCSVSCITGGAGTGKTTVLRTILKAFHELGYGIHALALSGRAAMRLHESTGVETKTIAAFLRQGTVTKKKQLVVIDEASMIDLALMYRIVTHTAPHVRFLFVGDPDQLPPIGAGRVLADIVASGIVKNTKLDIVKRQDGSTGIPEYSKQVNEGIVPPHFSTGNITYHQADNKTDIVNLCSELYSQSPRDSRVMAPTKELVKNINEKIQAKVNADGTPMTFTIGTDEFYLPLREGDEILFTRNDYQREIQNGLLGKLTSVKQDDHFKGAVSLDDGRQIYIDDDLLEQVELGYAITLHKAQGSQFPRIIIALHKGRILDRAWLYTAITRAENEVHIVGDKSVFASAIRGLSHTTLRNSYLSILLNKYNELSMT